MLVGNARLLVEDGVERVFSGVGADPRPAPRGGLQEGPLVVAGPGVHAGAILADVARQEHRQIGRAVVQRGVEVMVDPLADMDRDGLAGPGRLPDILGQPPYQRGRGAGDTLHVAVHRCSSSCFAEAFAREYGHQWTTIGVSGYGSWLVSTSRSLIRCSRRGCRRLRRTHFRTSRSLQTLHPSTPPALRSLRLPATVMAARCQRTTPQLPPPSTQTPIALAVCKSRSLSRSVRTSGFPFHSLYPA